MVTYQTKTVQAAGAPTYHRYDEIEEEKIADYSKKPI